LGHGEYQYLVLDDMGEKLETRSRVRDLTEYLSMKTGVACDDLLYILFDELDYYESRVLKLGDVLEKVDTRKQQPRLMYYGW
jgi:hypothetical protein